ncbi:hypothetical protein DPX16_17486 [Anabarilius grahami]|uniref:Uncharacterized protein n=1 Tax=Anabarilius grahami TaxID=495550 RepID=A0A3N0XZ49_ANAGA|nr:hypothetical protein DPX16_17486 [Anabarilius grahami]
MTKIRIFTGKCLNKQPAAAAAAEAFIMAVSEHNQHKIMDYIGFLYPQTAVQSDSPHLPSRGWRKMRHRHLVAALPAASPAASDFFGSCCLSGISSGQGLLRQLSLQWHLQRPGTSSAALPTVASPAAAASHSGTSGGISSGQGLLRQLSLERHLQRPRPRHRHLEQPGTVFGSTCSWPI